MAMKKRWAGMAVTLVLGLASGQVALAATGFTT
jgi:hypothetical protein